MSSSFATDDTYHGLMINNCSLHVPQEILDIIIDFLHDDRASILACALTGRAWRHRSQFHVHRVLKLTSPASCKRAKETYRKHFLVSCIREIHIHDLQFMPSGSEWVDQHVPSVVAKLRKVAPLLLEAVIIQDGYAMKWGDRPWSMFPDVAKLTIHRVQYRSVRDFTACLAHFPCLSTLFVKDLMIAAGPGSPAMLGPRPPLRSLDIHGTGQELVINWFLNQHPEDIRLETLTYSIERWQVRAPQASLKALGQSVQNLTVTFAYESPHYLLKGDPLLSKLTSIRNLTFEHATLYGTLYGPPSIPILLQNVSSLHVASVRFSFALDHDHLPLDESIQKLTRIKLSQTDALLGSLEAFEHLEDVLVQVRSNEWAKLTRLRTTDEWVGHDLEQRRISTQKRCAAWKSHHQSDCNFTPSLDPSDSEDDLLAAARADGDWEHAVAQRAHTDFVRTKEAWGKARNVFHSALPTAAGKKILRVEAVEYDPQERAPGALKYPNNTYHRHHMHAFGGLLLHNLL